MSDRGKRDSENALSMAPATNPSDGASSNQSANVANDASPESRERRLSGRFEVTWSVDCETEDTFLYAAITNISEMGIFVRTTEPLAVGTALTLRFAPGKSQAPFVLRGTVQWVNNLNPLRDNPNPGMGVRFIDLTPEARERIVQTIRTIAYLRESPEQLLN